MALTARDLAVIRDLARYGALSAEQVRRRHFPATGEGTRTALNRLRQLRLAGYVGSVPLGYHQHGAYLATSKGVAHAGGGLPAVRLWADGNPRPVAPPWVAHALAVRRRGGAPPGGAVPRRGPPPGTRSGSWPRRRPWPGARPSARTGCSP